MHYERTALSKNKAAMLAKSADATDADRVSPVEAIRDPFVLEFLNLKDEYSGPHGRVQTGTAKREDPRSRTRPHSPALARPSSTNTPSDQTTTKVGRDRSPSAGYHLAQSNTPHRSPILGDTPAAN